MALQYQVTVTCDYIYGDGKRGARCENTVQGWPKSRSEEAAKDAEDTAVETWLIERVGTQRRTHHYCPAHLHVPADGLAGFEGRVKEDLPAPSLETVAQIRRDSAKAWGEWESRKEFDRAMLDALLLKDMLQ